MRTGHPISIDGSDQKPVRAGREVGIVDSLLFCWRAPLTVCAFEHVLVAQRPARVEVNAEKLNLQIVLRVREFKVVDFRAAQFWNGATLASDAQPAQPHGRRDCLTLRLWPQARQSIRRAEPQRTAFVTKGDVDEISGQSILDRIMLDALGIRREPI